MLAVIDPGPEDEAHLAALLAAIAGRPVSHIFVSHTHRDHSPLAARLQAADRRDCPAPKARTGRRGRCASARSIRSTPAPTPTFMPDIALADDSVIDGDGWAITNGADARPYRQPRRLCAGRNRHPVLGRSRHGLVDLDRRAAGRRDGRLHGLARPAARARRPAVAARPWRAGDSSRAASCAG